MLGDGFYIGGVAVPDRNDRVPAVEVEVFVAVGVPNMATLAPNDFNVE